MEASMGAFTHHAEISPPILTVIFVGLMQSFNSPAIAGSFDRFVFAGFWQIGIKRRF